MDDKTGRASQIAAEEGRYKRAAAAMRHDATWAESMVWGVLRGKRLQGLRFRRQHVLYGYILDFYCHELRLCIELDGAPHLEPEQKAKDELRDSDLRMKGYTVIRMMNDAVLADLEGFRLRILEETAASLTVPPL
jgi:very-short-patch-repair endonuclease